MNVNTKFKKILSRGKWEENYPPSTLQVKKISKEQTEKMRNHSVLEVLGVKCQ